VPAAGVYLKVPGTLAVAFSSVLLSAVPYVIVGGVFQVIVGTPPIGTDVGLTTSEAYAVAEE
jgi:histidinol dehydrogenase